LRVILPLHQPAANSKRLFDENRFDAFTDRIYNQKKVAEKQSPSNFKVSRGFFSAIPLELLNIAPVAQRIEQRTSNPGFSYG